MFLQAKRRTVELVTGSRVAGLVVLLAVSLVACEPGGQPPALQGSPPAAQTTLSRPPTQASNLQLMPSATTIAPPVDSGKPASQVTPTPTVLACWNSGGHFETGALETELLRQPLEFRFYLPPCYDEQPERVYPALYLIHGQSFTDDQWQRLGVGEIAGELIPRGELPPFVIVMPRDRVWSEPTVDLFGQAVAEVLLPWIDANYRLIPARESRAVGGLSRGGAWALHLGINYPQLFSAVGMHSGFAFHSDVPSIRPFLEATSPGLIPRFYIDIGNNDRPDIAESAIWFEALLTSYQVPHEWHIFTGYHEEAYWQVHVEQYLRWYAQGWLP